jgi:hypothetical protein
MFVSLSKEDNPLYSYPLLKCPPSRFVLAEHKLVMLD